MTARYWGPVRMPVSVGGEANVLRNPDVNIPLVELGAIFVGAGPVGLPGKVPMGFIARGEMVFDVVAPACPPTAPLVISTLPRYQSKPKALVSSWGISTNMHLMLTWGGGVFSTAIFCSTISRSCSVARTMSEPWRSL